MIANARRLGLCLLLAVAAAVVLGAAEPGGRALRTVPQPGADPDTLDTRPPRFLKTINPDELTKAQELESIQSQKYTVEGRFRGFRTHRFDSDLTDEQRRLLEQLESIGYLSGSTEASELTGVTVHDRNRAWEGFNFYVSGHAPEAILMDMDGTVLHRWRHDFDSIWPDYPAGPAQGGKFHFRRAYLYPNGDILAIYEGLGIIKLDKDSNLIWANPNRAHHDLEVMPGGDIYVLTREARMIPRVDPDKPIQEDFITLLDAGGNEIRRVSVLECFENSGEYRSIHEKRWKRSGDIYHTNTLEVLDGRIAKEVPAFKAGNILTSMLNLDAIAVVDPGAARIVWAFQGDFQRQHDPQITPEGHLLLFNNNRGGSGQSSVQEYDPVTMKIVWEYEGTVEEPFYTRSCGAARRLPNGNTLMTESDNGRAIEVTPEKEIVWEFYNPERAGENNEYIATLFEVQRLDPDFPVHWIGKSESGDRQ